MNFHAILVQTLPHSIARSKFLSSETFVIHDFTLKVNFHEFSQILWIVSAKCKYTNIISSSSHLATYKPCILQIKFSWSKMIHEIFRPWKFEASYMIFSYLNFESVSYINLWLVLNEWDRINEMIILKALNDCLAICIYKTNKWVYYINNIIIAKKQQTSEYITYS